MYYLNDLNIVSEHVNVKILFWFLKHCFSGAEWPDLLDVVYMGGSEEPSCLLHEGTLETGYCLAKVDTGDQLNYLLNVVTALLHSTNVPLNKKSCFFKEATVNKYFNE